MVPACPPPLLLSPLIAAPEALPEQAQSFFFSFPPPPRLGRTCLALQLIQGVMVVPESMPFCRSYFGTVHDCFSLGSNDGYKKTEMEITSLATASRRGSWLRFSRRSSKAPLPWSPYHPHVPEALA
ncbi:hypothetical protein B0I35DRAFT_410789 [Stachybotrys elegans]|uniref:Uncharacterized protein n=1 Tax=Stachybotrys elegans TaxID=80388 RepID=A0A8K0WR71_9HYPO|nr:hypothetical protein B0I35DRAFT_410789 [Stachybotrys elegans]